MRINLKKIVLTVGMWMATGMYNGVPKYYSANTNIDINNKNKIALNNQISVKKGTGCVYDISKKEAEKSLDVLCRNTSVILEDSWMYYHNKLTDVGVNEMPLSVEINGVLLSLTLYNSKQNDTITLYHIHPTSYTKGDFSPPSVDDVMTHAVIQSGCDAKNIQLFESVFDGRGRWDLNVDKELIKKINTDERSQLEQRIRIGLVINRNYTAYKADNLTRYLDINRMFSSYDKYDSVAVQDYINNMHKIGIMLKFTPSEELQIKN